jgi:AraC-like DNA-binding protein
MSLDKYKESSRHGTDEFPLGYYLVDHTHPRYQMPLHWHSETELLYVQKGQFLLRLNDKEYTLEEGDLCYIASSTLHGGVPQDCIYECICFNTDALLKHSSLIHSYLKDVEASHALIQPVFTKMHPEISKCAHRLFGVVRSMSPGWELLALSGLYDFYGTVIQQDYREKPSDTVAFRRMQQIKLALEYIEKNYQNHITLEQLAQVSGLSPKYFCRYFRSILQKTPIDYLNHFRMVHARYLLEFGDHSIAEVASACGYADRSYFVRSFKKYTGLTPNQYTKLSQYQKLNG